MNYVHPKVKPLVERIKLQLKAIEWTCGDPDTYGHMNHGPIEYRQQAEQLYRQWSKLVNPYGI